MLIKKTTKIAILVAVIVVILLGTVLGVNYKRNLDVKNDIKAANSLITAYRLQTKSSAFCRGFFYEKRLRVSIFKTFKPLFDIMKISKKVVFSYDDSRN